MRSALSLAGWGKGHLAFALPLLLALLFARPAAAQDLLDFQYTERLTQTLLVQGRWHALDSVGRAAIRAGADYPALRRRLGEAAAATDHPAAAAQHFLRALQANPADGSARYGLVLAYLALNQRELAAYHAPGLVDSVRQRLRLLNRQAVTAVEVEVNGGQASTRTRGRAGYLRLGLSSRPSSWLSLAQSVSYFGQTVQLPDPGQPGGAEDFAVRQVDYHALLDAQLSARWQAQVGYHYVGAHFGGVPYPGHLGYAGVRYARPYWVARAGVYAGSLTDTARRQFDLGLTVYPLGNLRLYAFGRASAVRSSGRTFPNAMFGAGARLRPRLWAEAYGVVGRVPVLAEAGDTYVYNLLDPLRRRGSAGVYILLPARLLLRVHYTAEQRQRILSDTRYTLHSLTAALAWTW